jgi:hypothetical protein
MHNFRVYWISFYMFRTVFPSIIRSSRLYTHNIRYMSYRLGDFLLAGTRWNCKFHLVPASKQSTNLYDIYLMLGVQSWIPDDGRKDHPKHVDLYSVNSKIVHIVGFTTEIYHDARSNERQIRCSCLMACFSSVAERSFFMFSSSKRTSSRILIYPDADQSATEIPLRLCHSGLSGIVFSAAVSA